MKLSKKAGKLVKDFEKAAEEYKNLQRFRPDQHGIIIEDYVYFKGRLMLYIWQLERKTHE